MPRVTKKTIGDVIDLWDKVKRDHGCEVHPFQNPETGQIIWKPEDVVEHNEELTNLLMRVVRADKLADLPPELQSVAHQRMEMLRTFGDRKTLRRARRGLEKGVKRPFSESDVKLYAAISAAIKDLAKDLAPDPKKKDVLQWLKERDFLDKRTSRQSFDKLLTRLDALHLFEE